MTDKIERHIAELYADDPERADALVFGRRTGVERRGFLRGAGLAALGAAVGAQIPFSGSMPGGLVPEALAQGQAAGPKPAGPKLLQFPGKDGRLVVLGERPLVAETPEALLDDDTTPNDKFFIRNNGNMPEPVTNPGAWKLVVDGEVNNRLELTVDDLKSRFQQHSYHMVLECGGNGRSQFNPPARGNQWTNGGAGCAKWTGVRVKDVLQAAGLKPSARYTGHYGADPHLSGEAGKPTLSRGAPMAKMMDDHNLIVFAMNDQPLPAAHGFPLRLVVPGWPGSLSSKWLNRIWVRDREHDGPGMGGASYRVANEPMVPGEKEKAGNLKILESMPVRSIVTSPANGTRYSDGARDIAVRGKTWAGDLEVRQVDVSIDFGARWQKAELAPARNRYDWQRWSASIRVSQAGYYEIWARATDSNGVMQPHIAGFWNPQGYGANAMHRVAILVQS